MSECFWNFISLSMVFCFIYIQFRDAKISSMRWLCSFVIITFMFTYMAMPKFILLWNIYWAKKVANFHRNRLIISIFRFRNFCLFHFCRNSVVRNNAQFDISPHLAKVNGTLFASNTFFFGSQDKVMGAPCSAYESYVRSSKSK